MKLKWYGQASFLITASDGTRIVTDPYTPELAGYQMVRDDADIAISSSDNDDFHCRTDLIPGNPIRINALEVAQQGGSRTEKGIEFRAIEAMEALDHAFHDPDQNALYRFTVDGVRIGHMGDVGNPLSAEQMAFYENLDVLLALTGGHPTILLDDLKAVIDTVQPKLVVPMHFRTLSYKPRNILWLQSFLDYFPDDVVDFACACEAEITTDSLPESTRVLVIDYVQCC